MGGVLTLTLTTGACSSLVADWPLSFQKVTPGRSAFIHDHRTWKARSSQRRCFPSDNRSLATATGRRFSGSFSNIISPASQYLFPPERCRPPKQICEYVRHISSLGPLDQEPDIEHFTTILGDFPILASIAIKETQGKIPWSVDNLEGLPHPTTCRFVVLRRSF